MTVNKKTGEKVRKVHPYHDATAEWLRTNDGALDKLRTNQRHHLQRVRESALQSAQAWFDYCVAVSAPKAVVTQARLNLQAAKARV